MRPSFSVRLHGDHWHIDYTKDTEHGVARKSTFKEALQFVLDKSADSEDLNMALFTNNSSIYISG